LTNNFAIPAQTVAGLYRYRWQVELFFKWIKQHLRINSFFGTSENFENTLLALLVTRMESRSDTAYIHNQLNLFDNSPG